MDELTFMNKDGWQFVTLVLGIGVLYCACKWIDRHYNHKEKIKVAKFVDKKEEEGKVEQKEASLS